MDRIDVHFEDFLFGVGLLDLDGRDHLLQFSRNCFLESYGVIQVSGELLRDRTEPLSKLRGRDGVDHHRPDDVPEGYPPVGVEPPILGGDSSADQLFGDFL